MATLLALLLGLIAEAGPVSGIPAPPAGNYEAELSKLAADRAKAEIVHQLDAVLRDPSSSASDKAEAKSRVEGARLKLAIYTTDRSLEETIAFYTGKVPGAAFLTAERNILIDLQELAEIGKFTVPPATAREWKGKSGRTARWTREDQMLQISVEDYLIDPRDGKVAKKTVVLVSAFG